MSGKEVFQLADKPINCFSFNKDRTRVAFSPNDTTVQIFKKVGQKWERESVLTEHSQIVTGIDWAPNSDRLVTCGSDRNAYVWIEQDGKWKPTLVLLRINRAATCVKWSPKEDKFAVASGARLISICFFEKENDWWVSKHIKKPIRSTVLSLDWHPNNVLLAAGSSDFKARVFSSYIKEIEDKPTETCWGKKMPFGTLMAEFSNGGGGWVHDVSFSASGNKLAWVGHDSSLSVVDKTKDDCLTYVKTKDLPFMACSFVTENSIVVAGHNFVPMVFLHDDKGSLTFVAQMDQAVQKEEETMSAMAKFRSLDKHSQGHKEAKSLTTHANTINQVEIYAGDKAKAVKISTGGVDGRIVIWDVKTLEKSIADLKIV